jgi:thiamine-monophosphate kinase
MNESEIVRKLRERLSSSIGDDAAIVGDDVVTTDMLVEDVDFTAAAPAALLARKSLAVNLSDLAAMGATPTWALVALALPQWFRPKLDVFIDALAAMAREYRIEVVGGDLSRSAKLVIAVTAAGRIERRPLLRSGARPGEAIYLSRPIGGSGAGLELLQRGWSPASEPPGQVSYAQREFAVSAIRRHLDPEPEVALGRKLAQIGDVTSCIDVSDGLSTDLHHLCQSSRCGAVIEQERIPLFPDLLAHGPSLGIPVRDVVLHGGEEYALLFTSRLREAELSARVGRPVYMIGRMTESGEVMIREGDRSEPLQPRGWDHFA